MPAASEAVWTSKDIILAIIATGLVSALAGWAADFVKERWSEKRSARYAAMRCAVAFEHYAADCWNNANMSEGHYSMIQEAYSKSLPPAPAIPEDIDWRPVDPILADAVLSFMTSSGSRNQRRITRVLSKAIPSTSMRLQRCWGVGRWKSRPNYAQDMGCDQAQSTRRCTNGWVKKPATVRQRA